MVTLFPEVFEPLKTWSVLGRALKQGVIRLTLVDLRSYCEGPHRQADDYPYGGGPGMVMKPEPFFAAVEAQRSKSQTEKERVILLSPAGQRLTHEKVVELAGYERLILLCGHYEGVDERVAVHLCDEQLSIGDYVLTGGEIPAMVVVDAVSRWVEGCLSEEARRDESFAGGLLEYPHFTRPAVFRQYEAPSVLLSGDHEAIARFRRKEQLRRTRARRQDLWARFRPDGEDARLIAEIEEEERDVEAC